MKNVHCSFFAYKMREKSDGRISGYVIRDLFDDYHFFTSFCFFKERFLQNSCGRYVMCCPPANLPNGEKIDDDDEDFDRVCLDDEEIDEIRRYFTQKDLVVFCCK